MFLTMFFHLRSLSILLLLNFILTGQTLNDAFWFCSNKFSRWKVTKISINSTIHVGSIFLYYCLRQCILELVIFLCASPSHLCVSLAQNTFYKLYYHHNHITHTFVSTYRQTHDIFIITMIIIFYLNKL